MSINKRFSVLAILTFILMKRVDAKCEQSYANFCDDISDIDAEDPEEIAKWRELVIGNKNNNDPSQMLIINSTLIPFAKLPKLTSLTLLNKVEDIETSALVSDHLYTRLEMLTIYGGSLKRLKFNSFNDYTLRMLKITNTDLEYIPERVFSNCKIKTIDFSGNKLEGINNGVFTGFDGANETLELILRNNKIRSLHQDGFTTGLQILNLDHNKIQVLNGHIFQHWINLRELTLSYNQLSALPYHVVANLTKLHTLNLSHNRLILLRMDLISPLIRLQVLDASYNKLSNPNFFKHFTIENRTASLQISLVFNRFTHLNVDTEELKNPNVLVLYYGNPWICKCWTQMEQVMAQRQHLRNRCDVKFFSNGQTPFCYEYPGNWTCQEAIYKGPKVDQSDYDVFFNSIKNNRKLFHCDLTIRSYDYRFVLFTNAYQNGNSSDNSE